jgi:hypothetical protein
MKEMRYDPSDGRMWFRRSILLFLLVALIPAFGCSLTVPMSRPTPSSFQYAVRQEAPITVVVKDSRPEAEKKLSKGRFDVEITGLGEDLTFLAEDLAKELNARGIKAVAGTSGPDMLVLDVDRFYIRNHRPTAFNPWVTFTNFRAKAVYRGTRQRVAAYFHAGMVPKWSMSEIVEPTYNYPMSVAIKEIATKLNRLYFRSTPPADLLRRKIDAVKRDPQLDTILELGFLGSPDALPTLESLVKTSSSGNVVTYALDAIGIIGDPKSFPFLRDYHKSSESKGLLFSLKAIGDLGTPEALAYLRNVPVDHGNIEEIVELYTQ